MKGTVEQNVARLVQDHLTAAGRTSRPMTYDELVQRIDSWEDSGRFDMLEFLEDLAVTPALFFDTLAPFRKRNALALLTTAQELGMLTPAARYIGHQLLATIAHRSGDDYTAALRAWREATVTDPATLDPQNG